MGLNEGSLRARARVRPCRAQIVLTHRGHTIDGKPATRDSGGNTERMMRTMDFLVRWDFCRVYELPEEERAALMEGERARGRELFSQGVIRQLWQIPNTRTNIGIWSAADADALEEAFASLPLRPYSHIEVTALATFP
jgi:muconolactone D-isomerase